MLTDTCLHKFDVHQGKVVLRVVLRATQTLDIMIFFKIKIFLSNVRFDIYLVRRNIVSTEQSVRALKKSNSGLLSGNFF